MWWDDEKVLRNTREGTPIHFLSYICTFALSAVAAAAVIVRVVWGRYMQRGKARMGAEKLLTQLILMVSILDLIFAVMWLGWYTDLFYTHQLTAVSTHILSSTNTHWFVAGFGQMLMYTSHLTLAGHMYAWTVVNTSPSKLAHKLPKRVASAVVFALVMTSIVCYGMGRQNNDSPAGLSQPCSRHNVVKCWGYTVLGLGPASLLIIAVLYSKSYAQVRALVRRSKLPPLHPHHHPQLPPHQQHSKPPPHDLFHLTLRIRNRLLEYALLFMIIWGIDSFCTVFSVLWGPHAGEGANQLLRVCWNLNSGLAGFFDAAVLGWRGAGMPRTTPPAVNHKATHKLPPQQRHDHHMDPPMHAHNASTSESRALVGPHAATHTSWGGERNMPHPQRPVHACGAPSLAAPHPPPPPPPHHTHHTITNAFTARASPASPQPPTDRSHHPSHEARVLANSHHHLTPRSIYATTYNMGGASSVGTDQLKEWLPHGYDLYVIALQECECFSELVTSIVDLLGGPEAYVAYWSDIGDATIMHGKIAMLVLGRRADVECGALCAMGGVRGRVHRGVSVMGIARAPNKGMVGLAFRWHDVCLAMIGVHFAADKKGASGTHKRMTDATRTLQDLVLVSEDIDFDLHLQTHHVIVLGDMNFRVQESPEWVLEQTAQSIRCEMEAHRRRRANGRRQGESSKVERHRGGGGGGGRSYGGGGGGTGVGDVCGGDDGGVADGQVHVRVQENEDGGCDEDVEDGDVGGGDVEADGDDGDGGVEGGGEGGRLTWRDEGRRLLRGSWGRHGGGGVCSRGHRTRGTTPRQANKLEAMEEGRAESPSLSQHHHTNRHHDDRPQHPHDPPLPPSLHTHEETSDISKSRWALSSMLGSLKRLVKGSDRERGESDAIDSVWGWVAESDELSMAMREGRVFHGFREPTIRFPPTFKCFPGAPATGFNDPSRLTHLYKTHVHESSSTSLRTAPSFLHLPLPLPLPRLPLPSLPPMSYFTTNTSETRPPYTSKSTHPPSTTELHPTSRPYSTYMPTRSELRPSHTALSTHNAAHSEVETPGSDACEVVEAGANRHGVCGGASSGHYGTVVSEAGAGGGGGKKQRRGKDVTFGWRYTSGVQGDAEAHGRQCGGGDGGGESGGGGDGCGEGTGNGVSASRKSSVVKRKIKMGVRTPSYTDRVLVHSLMPDRLAFGHYDVIESVTMSDHRPVALTMHIMVDDRVHGFHVHTRATAPTQHHDEASGVRLNCEQHATQSRVEGVESARVEQSSLEGRAEGCGVGEGMKAGDGVLREPRVCVSVASMTGGGGGGGDEGFRCDVEVGAVGHEAQRAIGPGDDSCTTKQQTQQQHHAPPEVSLGNDHQQRKDEQGQPHPPKVWLCEVALEGMELMDTLSTHTNHTHGGAGIEEVHVHFPMIVEDPLAPQRRVVSIHEQLLGTAMAPKQVTGLDQLSPDLHGWSCTDLAANLQLLKSMHVFRWSKRGPPTASPRIQRGVEARFITLVALKFSTHALIKLVDRHGVDVGQGVIPLRGPVDRALGIAPTAHSYHHQVDHPYPTPPHLVSPPDPAVGASVASAPSDRSEALRVCGSGVTGEHGGSSIHRSSSGSSMSGASWLQQLSWRIRTASVRALGMGFGSLEEEEEGGEEEGEGLGPVQVDLSLGGVFVGTLRIRRVVVTVREEGA